MTLHSDRNDATQPSYLQHVSGGGVEESHLPLVRPRQQPVSVAPHKRGGGEYGALHAGPPHTQLNSKLNTSR